MVGIFVRLAILTGVLLLLTPGQGLAQRELAVQRHHLPHAPAWFIPQARCIHHYEESTSWRWTPNYHPRYSYWNHYWTGMQFAGSTWQRANRLLHMRTSPYTGSPRLVMLHAYAIWRDDGGSWREWSTAYLCGLR